MASIRAMARGLSTDDLTRIRDTLAAGRKPKVMFTEAAGQVAGQVGQVVELTDPAASDEWVVVRFGRDELPFSPADLTVPTKSAAGRSPSRRPTASADAELAEPKLTEPVRAELGPAEPAPAVAARPMPSLPNPREESAVAPSPATSAGVNGSTVSRDVATPAPGGSKVDAAGRAGEVGPAPRRSAAARKGARPKTPPSLTVTLTYSDGEWMVAATQGSRALAKPYVIRPADALKLISTLDVPGIQEAVEDIVSAARAEAEGMAERLRAELAAVESRLAELRGAS